MPLAHIRVLAQVYSIVKNRQNAPHAALQDKCVSTLHHFFHTIIFPRMHHSRSMAPPPPSNRIPHNHVQYIFRSWTTVSYNAMQQVSLLTTSSRWEPASSFEELGVDALLHAWWARVEQDTGCQEKDLTLRWRDVQASAEHISKRHRELWCATASLMCRRDSRTT